MKEIKETNPSAQKSKHNFHSNQLIEAWSPEHVNPVLHTTDS